VTISVTAPSVIASIVAGSVTREVCEPPPPELEVAEPEVTSRPCAPATMKSLPRSPKMTLLPVTGSSGPPPSRRRRRRRVGHVERDRRAGGDTGVGLGVAAGRGDRVGVPRSLGSEIRPPAAFGLKPFAASVVAVLLVVDPEPIATLPVSLLVAPPRGLAFALVAGVSLRIGLIVIVVLAAVGTAPLAATYAFVTSVT
jgi:hypothetical protein